MSDQQKKGLTNAAYHATPLTAVVGIYTYSVEAAAAVEPWMPVAVCVAILAWDAARFMARQGKKKAALK